jgi:phosphopantothenoylcysteine decarboxylase/phosphopantothenate--cysteine ligase
MGHIRLSREADLIVLAPATADIIGKMANGLADDLASTILLATDKDILVVPAMNIKMFSNNAVQRNVTTLLKDGIIFVGPEDGELACGEKGMGRMSEPDTILKSIKEYFNNA